MYSPVEPAIRGILPSSARDFGAASAPYGLLGKHLSLACAV